MRAIKLVSQQRTSKLTPLLEQSCRYDKKKELTTNLSEEMFNVVKL